MILHRIITWEADGITWEPDPRHAELVIEQLGLGGGKPLKLLGVKEATRRDKMSEEELEADVAAIQADIEEKLKFEAKNDYGGVLEVKECEVWRDGLSKSDGWNFKCNNIWKKTFEKADKF